MDAQTFFSNFRRSIGYLCSPCEGSRDTSSTHAPVASAAVGQCDPPSIESKASLSAFRQGPPPLPSERPRRPSNTYASDGDMAKSVSADLRCEGKRVTKEAKPCPDIKAELEEVLAAATRAAKSADAKIVRLSQQLQNPEEAARLHIYGRALQAAPEESLHSGAKIVELPDPDVADFSSETGFGTEWASSENSYRKVCVPLPKPGKGLKQNAEACFSQAEKIERTNARCSEMIPKIEAEALHWAAAVKSLQEWYSRLPTTSDSDGEALATSLAALHAELREAGHIKECKVNADPGTDSIRRKYGKHIDCFLSPNGHEVIVGRDAAANEQVSYELALPDGFWFHSDCGVPGSHVIIFCPASEVYALEDVKFAAAVAAWHSKARSYDQAPVVYCYGAQIARPAVPKLGQVRILGQRGSIRVKPAPPIVEPSGSDI